MLFGQLVAVDAGHEQGQIISSLGHAEPFVIRPRIGFVAQAGRRLRVVKGDHAQVFGRGEGLDEVKQRLDGKAGPGHGHGPGFHAAVAVQTLFKRHLPHQVVNIEGLGLMHQPGHLNLPGAGLPALDQAHDHLFTRAELVEIIVIGRVHFGRQRSVQGKLLIALRRVEAGAGTWFGEAANQRGFFCAQAFTPGEHTQRADTGDPERLQKGAPVQENVFRGCRALRNFPAAWGFDQHAVSFLLRYVFLLRVWPGALNRLSLS